MDLRPTFASAWDRLTYVVVEAQILVAGGLMAAGLGLWWFDPAIPSAPEWLKDFLTAWLVLTPLAFPAGLRIVDWLRTRNHVEVHEVNAVEDTVEKWLVPPEVWAEKTVEGADPWPVNGGSAWAVRSFEWHGETEDLFVTGVWLSELEDTKLLTSKRHMESCYDKLTESHITLGVMRDSISELGADLQHRLINRLAKARERGEHLDKTAVKDVFEDFEEDAESLTESDLPTLTVEDLPEFDRRADPTPETGEVARQNGEQAAATDGGEQGP